MNGELVIGAPMEKVYPKLVTPEFMASTIPDVQDFKIVDPEHFEARVKVGISVVRGIVGMKFAILDKSDDSHARLVGDGAGAGSTMHIESAFDLSSESGGTKIKWTADVEISGLIAGIGSSILKGQTEKQVSQIFQNIKAKLES